MKKWLWILILLPALACNAVSLPVSGLLATATLVPSWTPIPTSTPAPTITLTPTLDYPAEGFGPQFPAGIDPLTGLKVADPALLERRPMAIKISNLPRSVRPQWGVSFADHVYEYYTEEGTTRFIAVFLGRDAKMVGPIRSARFFDIHVIRMYKAIFAYGSGDYRVRARLENAGFYSRLVWEFPAGCPPMCRYEPNGADYLITNTADLSAYSTRKGITNGNGRQDLDGLLFKVQPPAGGTPVTRAYVHYSRAIYNLWEYDPATGRYLRSSDRQNSDDNGKEIYQQQSDRLTGQPIGADNLVVLYVKHQYYSVTPEIVDIVASGPGDAYVFRDGQMYKVRWQRSGQDNLIQLVQSDRGPLFALKPGTTWFEVVGTSTRAAAVQDGWRFVFGIP